ncbi:MAG: filamentous hemagglutinin N-terminal domain-containing protein [Pseudomonadota bacterium]|nr:filamentous hemagglutinin N-terminal domain-containing protein [Pseudomonadota bacterium]
MPLHAEVVLDGTLGPKGALPGPEYLIGAELGQQQGSNLFHSFSDFNLNQNESATFSGSANIHNVISRITGGRASEIDGALRSTIPAADFYLINPSGLMFGPNATLDIQGSFHASTADSVQLQDGGEFNATRPGKSILTAAPPAAFGFLTDTPAALSIRGSQLAVPEQETVSLIGGDIDIKNARVTASFGRLNLAGVAEQGEVAIEDNDLVVPESRGDVTLKDSVMDLDGEGGGAVFVRAGQFVLDKSDISVSTLGAEDGRGTDIAVDEFKGINDGRVWAVTLGSGQGSDIKIKVKGTAEFTGREALDPEEDEQTRLVGGIYSQSGDSRDKERDINKQNIGKAGNIILEAEELHLTQGTQLSVLTVSPGEAGDITVVADKIMLSGQTFDGAYPSAIFSTSESKMDNTGNGGTIQLEAQQLHLTQGAQVGTYTLSTGQAGNLVIKVSGEVKIADRPNRPSGIFSSAESTQHNAGKGGVIQLEAGRLLISGGGQIGAFTFGQGQGGDIDLKIKGNFDLSGASEAEVPSFVVVAAGRESLGDAGNITVEAAKVNVSEDAQILVSTSGTGQAGVVHVKANNLSIKKGTISASTVDGQGGSVRLDLKTLIADTGALITAQSSGRGKGGSVQIKANHILLTKGSTISAVASGLGNAGQINIVVNDVLEVNDILEAEDKSVIETETQHSDGGDIVINSNGYLYFVNSKLTTSVHGDKGDGGNITTRSNFVILDGSFIQANAFEGDGGNIHITTIGLYKFPPRPSPIEASSEYGLDGEITVDSPDVNVSEQLVTLSNELLKIGELPPPCYVKISENIGSFQKVERGGVPRSYNDFLPSDSGLVNAEKISAAMPITKKSMPYRLEFMQAQCEKRLM